MHWTEIPATNMVGLDFETYSAVDLPTHGLNRYLDTPTFQVLLSAVAIKESSSTIRSLVLPFAADPSESLYALDEILQKKLIVAHNAGFEQLVLRKLGIYLPSNRFIDSAVLARAAGAGGKLEAAAAQLLGKDKLTSGLDLIKKFSIPGEYQERNGNEQFDPRIMFDNTREWWDFAHYCAVDAELSLELAELILPDIDPRELDYASITLDMNNTGWYVDRAVVEQMKEQYERNLETTVLDFRIDCNEWDLNLFSHAQLKAWCAQRGVKANSFDESAVQGLLNRLKKKLLTNLTKAQQANYSEIVTMLEAKQVLGGSSLKKLQVILDTMGRDNRLYDQYLHIGAGASYRTTGRGAQMQNLPRLNGGGDDMQEILWGVEWDNATLSANLRQVFTATHPDGALVVGDFSSVESRGLAWQSGEDWKIEAYARGEDLYKVLAGRIFHKPTDDVVKEERQIGKVGELACGYGAGGDAVHSFAGNMGVAITVPEAIKLVRDWRAANPHTVQYWQELDRALHEVLTEPGIAFVNLPHGTVTIRQTETPESLLKQQPGVQSLRVHMRLHNGYPVLTRVIHGCYLDGRNIKYFKPSERKTGDLWKPQFRNAKTKRLQYYTIYGGKLAGILTQSLCREMFFHSLSLIHDWTQHVSNVQLIGQFHDEVVLDWAPGDVTLAETEVALSEAMTTTVLPGFPLAAEIKHDYRYTK